MYLTVAHEVIAMAKEPSVSSSSSVTSSQSKLGRIELLGRAGATDCIVRSLTDMKAVLEVRLPRELPVEFDLLIDPDQKRHRCGIIKRRAHSVEVAFI